MPCSTCKDPARCDRAGLCQEFKAAFPDRRTLVTQDQHKLEPVAHVHSNGDFCADRQITSKDWPVYLYTEAQVNELRAHLQQRPLPVSACPGIDTRAEDYCAWRDEWNKGHAYPPADGDAFDAGFRYAWKRARPLPVREGTAQPLSADYDPEKDPAFYTWTWDVWVSGGNWRAEYGWEKPPKDKKRIVRNVRALFTHPSPSLPVREEPTHLSPVPAAVPAGQVVAWMWQHEETGRVGFIDQWQIDNGWQAANPRLRLIRPLVFAPSPSVQKMGEGETGKDGVDVPLAPNSEAKAMDDACTAYLLGEALGDDAEPTYEKAFEAGWKAHAAHGVDVPVPPSMVGVGTDRIEQPQATHGASHLYGVKVCPKGGDHELVSARNEAIQSGLICTKCHGLFPEPCGVALPITNQSKDKK